MTIFWRFIDAWNCSSQGWYLFEKRAKPVSDDQTLCPGSQSKRQWQLVNSKCSWIQMWKIEQLNSHKRNCQTRGQMESTKKPRKSRRTGKMSRDIPASHFHTFDLNDPKSETASVAKKRKTMEVRQIGACIYCRILHKTVSLQRESLTELFCVDSF